MVWSLGVNLAPIVVKRVVGLGGLRAKSLAVDANGYLYQFLALVRTPDGSPLTDSSGNVTSHLAGLVFRTTRLLHDYGVFLVFVFDGRPPRLKEAEAARRRELRERALSEWRRALEVGGYAMAFSKAVMTARLTRPMIEDAKRVLGLLGVAYVQAPGEAEAQAAYMTMRGDVWAASSKDYDSLLFGAPRLVRFLTITGRDYLPSRGTFRPLKPELIELRELLARHKITREQLVDVAILIGTDFNSGVRGIGPKRALELLKAYGRLENLPGEIRERLPADYEEVRKIFLQPEVSDDYSLEIGELQEEELYRFLCEERGFSRKRVETAVERMRRFHSAPRQVGLDRWLA